MLKGNALSPVLGCKIVLCDHEPLVQETLTCAVEFFSPWKAVSRSKGSDLSHPYVQYPSLFGTLSERTALDSLPLHTGHFETSLLKGTKQ